MKHPLSSIKKLATAQRLLSGKPDRAAPLEEVLGLIGPAIEVERVRVYKLSSDGTLFEFVAQWAEKGATKLDESPLTVDTIETFDFDVDDMLAVPIYKDSNLVGMLMVQTDAIRTQFEPESKELLANVAIMLAPYLNAKASSSSPPKLTRPNEGSLNETSDDLNVLIVEDDRANLFVLEKLIEKFGAVPHAARNGKDAVEICKKIKFDLILMDLTMPQLDGFDATREIITGENPNRKTPVVAVTADVTDGIERRCKKIGMQQYISKPLRRDTITKVLTELTQKKSKSK